MVCLQVGSNLLGLVDAVLHELIALASATEYGAVVVCLKCMDQMAQIKKMGSLTDIMGMMPGVDKKALANVDLDDKRLVHIEAMITSMTAKERENPDIINGSRKKRIAAGSGTTPAEINAFLKQFNQMRMLMKQFSNPKKMKKLMGGFKGLF